MTMHTHWLPLSVGSLVLASTTAVNAAQIVTWQFESTQNKLVFSTDVGVQPKAQLLANPSRLVIDLPGTKLGQSTTRRNVGGAVAQVRAGQFNAETTRFVVELAPGYTINPNQVKIEGLAPNRWSVALPTPTQQTKVTDTTPKTPDLQVTRNGLFLRLPVPATSKVQVERSGDRRAIAMTLPGVRLPSHLESQTLTVDRYGVESIQFIQGENAARLLLEVNPDSPDWNAAFSRLGGGLALVPRGGITAVADQNSEPIPPPIAIQPPSPPPTASVSIPVPPPRTTTPVATTPPPPPPPPIATTPSPKPTTVPTPVKPSPPPTTTPSQPLPQIPNERVVVMIDPGHGGRDPGAVGINGLKEKDVILPISHEVSRLLEQQGVQVQMTRKTDRFVTLGGRAELANRGGADLFVSIHANAISMSRPEVNGAETFYYQSGRGLAQSIQNSIIRSTNLNNRGVKQARFYVLKHTAMPAVLVEVGFVTGREDAPKLADPKFRDQMAEAIARGILEYVRTSGV